MIEDVDGAKRIASALLRDCIHVLALPHPPLEPPGRWKECQSVWRTKWAVWASGRGRELRFLNSQRSIMWCEILEMDRDALVDRLRDRGLIYDHREMVPSEARQVGTKVGRKPRLRSRAT